MKCLLSVTVLVALSMSVISCGADDDDDSGGAAGSAGSSGTGAGGTSGVGGSKPSTGGSGAPAMTGVPCGGTTCMSMGPMIPGFMIPGLPTPCCLDMATSKCGVSMNGGACMPPPPPPMADPSCPGARMGMSGCCINGDCGQDASFLGMGCVENGAAARASMGLFMVPPPRKCGLPPDPPADAGMPKTDDAGI